jgi:general secretion pathway protein I
VTRKEKGTGAFCAKHPKGRSGKRRLSPIPVRAAFSLMEVILALGILAGAMILLGELAHQGLRHAGMARDITQAELICESKLAEITSGMTSPESVASAPVESDLPGSPTSDKWLYSVEVNSGGQDGLLSVRVTVSNANAPDQPGHSVSLTRWMLDPNWTPSGQSTTEDDASSMDLGGTP